MGECFLKKNPLFCTLNLITHIVTLFFGVVVFLKSSLSFRKYVVPTPIEEAIGMSRFIAQVVLSGANRPYNVALLVPEWHAIRMELKIEASVSDDQLAADGKVQALIDKEIINMCSRLKKFEIPQKWAFVAPFTAANNMLTPKMSIRRHKVISHYGESIQHLYGDPEVVADSADSRGAKEHAEERAA
jgi:long-chain acyl-CoA synthetase